MHFCLNSVIKYQQMGKKICFLLLYILFSVGSMSQFAFPTIGARAGAMGGASVALTDFWSAVDNVAALQNVGGPAVGTVLKQTFMMDRLCYKTLAFSVPVSEVGAVAMRYTHFGKAIYSEQRLSAAYSQRLGNHVAVGAELCYLYCGTTDVYYDSYHRLSFAVASQMYITPDITIGFHVFNPFAVALNANYSLPIPSVVRLGMAYSITPELMATVELEKNIYMRCSIRSGMEYVFLNGFYARLGFSTAPLIYTFGVGVERGRWSADIGTQVHNALGVSPMLSVMYSI